MKCSVLAEYGFQHAMMGLALSYGTIQKVTSEGLLFHMTKVAKGLAFKDGGHNKFLETMGIWLDIRAPRYWWQEFDTYRVGITKQSESTMHTLKNRPLNQGDFRYKIPETYLEHLNYLVKHGKLEQLKNDLPEGFMQRRIVATNYKTIQNMYKQRCTHRLTEWRIFCAEVLWGAKHPYFIVQEDNDGNQHSQPGVSESSS